jgi:hypothetical protein
MILSGKCDECEQTVNISLKRVYFSLGKKEIDINTGLTDTKDYRSTTITLLCYKCDICGHINIIS